MKQAVILLVALLPSLAQCRESVCLKSGFCLQAESHVISEGKLILQSGSGTLEFPADQIAEILALPTPIEAGPGSGPVNQPVNTPGSASNAVPNSEELLMRAALRQGLKPDFVRSVAMVESGLHQESLSPKGAIGLMQLMPVTAGQLGVDPKLAEQNALGGAAFLRQLLIKYNGNSALALAAYNAGPGAVDRYRGVPPYLETQRYVVKVLKEYARQQHSQAARDVQVANPAKQATAANRSSSENLRAQVPTHKLAGDVAVQR